MSRERKNASYYAMYRPLAQTAMEHIKNTVADYIDPNKNIGTKKMARQRKYNKRRQNKKKRIFKRGIPKLITPQNKLIKVRMSDYQTFSSTGGVIVNKNISGTDITDPLAGSSAQRPLGYNQWKALYHTAYVVGVKVKATCWNNNSTSAIMFGITACPKEQAGNALDNYEHYREVPHTVSKLLTPDVDKGVLTLSTSTRKHLGLKNIKDNDTIRVNLTSDSAPSEVYYYHIWMQPLDQSSTVSAVPMVLDVEYIVLLTNPVVPDRS